MCCNVRWEVLADQILVVVEADRVDQFEEHFLGTKSTLLDAREDLLQFWANVCCGWSIVHSLFQFIHFVDLSSKDEHVVDAHFLRYFDVGSIHSADDKPTIHDEFHVTGA